MNNPIYALLVRDPQGMGYRLRYNDQEQAQVIDPSGEPLMDRWFGKQTEAWGAAIRALLRDFTLRFTGSRGDQLCPTP